MDREMVGASGGNDHLGAWDEPEKESPARTFNSTKPNQAVVLPFGS